MRLERHVALMGDEKCIHNFSRKPERKRSLTRTRCRWEDNINM